MSLYAKKKSGKSKKQRQPVCVVASFLDNTLVSNVLEITTTTTTTTTATVIPIICCFKVQYVFNDTNDST